MGRAFRECASAAEFFDPMEGFTPAAIDSTFASMSDDFKDVRLDILSDVL